MSKILHEIYFVNLRKHGKVKCAINIFFLLFFLSIIPSCVLDIINTPPRDLNQLTNSQGILEDYYYGKSKATVLNSHFIIISDENKIKLYTTPETIKKIINAPGKNISVWWQEKIISPFSGYIKAPYHISIDNMVILNFNDLKTRSEKARRVSIVSTPIILILIIYMLFRPWHLWRKDKKLS